MTILRGHRLGGKQWVVNTVAVPVVTPGGGTSGNGVVPDKLSAVEFVQPDPVGVDTFGGVPVGWFVPTGGIGPYTYFIANRLGKYALTLDVLSEQEPAVGTVADTMTCLCTDGRGDTASVTFTVQKDTSGASGLTFNTKNPISNNCPVRGTLVRYDLAPTFSPSAYGPGHLDVRGDVLAVTTQTGTASTLWNVGTFGIQSTGKVPVAGNYPVTVSRTNPTSDARPALGPDCLGLAGPERDAWDQPHNP
jgi:hypothetical protein